VNYDECAAPVALQPTVRCLWMLSDSPEPSAEPDSAVADANPAFPDGSPELIFCLGDPLVAVAPDGSEREQPRVFLVGQITRPFRVRPAGRVDLVGIRLEAFGASWAVADLRAIEDDFVDLTRWQGGALEALLRRLGSNPTFADRSRVVSEGLSPLIARGRTPDPRVVSAVLAIRAAHGLVDVATLAPQIGVTPRTLQRLFARDVGITFLSL
jgi:hypothetical protein